MDVDGRAREDERIVAVVARLPRRLLRQLRNHPDVVALSTDAPVTSMQASPPVGTVYTVTTPRSGERRVGQECQITCRSRGPPER